MYLFHSTAWEELESILKSDLIEPAPIKPADCKNPILGMLKQFGIDCAWFSTQAWSSNRFGPYIFEFDVNDIVTSDIVDLGNHNGARCYLSLPPLLAAWTAGKIGRSLINYQANTSWHPKSKEDRVDILVGWKVPASTTIHFTSSTKINVSYIEGDANFAKARFAAKILLSGENRFDISLDPPIQTAAVLLRWLIGNSLKKFSNISSQSLSGVSPNKSEFLEVALISLTEPDIDMSAICAAYIGNIDDVADELAILINRHFSVSLTGSAIVAVI